MDAYDDDEMNRVCNTPAWICVQTASQEKEATSKLVNKLVQKGWKPNIVQKDKRQINLMGASAAKGQANEKQQRLCNDGKEEDTMPLTTKAIELGRSNCMRLLS